MLAQAHDPGAVAHAALVELVAAGHEARAADLGRVVGRPERERVAVGVLGPAQAAGQVGLDRDPRHVLEAAQLRQGLLIPGPDQALAPGREQDPQPVRLAFALDPGHEALDLAPVALHFGARLAPLGEGAVVAAVVAADQRAPIEQGQLAHVSS